MLHFSCDRCKRVIDPDRDARYTVRLEVHAVMDCMKDEAEDDRDHLLEIQEILERLNDSESELIGEDVYQLQRFDLCPECYRKYIQSPVGHEPAAQVGFSQN